MSHRPVPSTPRKTISPWGVGNSPLCVSGLGMRVELKQELGTVGSFHGNRARMGLACHIAAFVPWSQQPRPGEVQVSCACVELW